MRLGSVNNTGRVWATGQRLVTPVCTLDLSKITTRRGCRWRGNLEEGSEKKGRNVGENGYVAGEGEFENRGQEPLGPEKRAKNFFENSFLRYMVSLVGPVVKPFGTTVKKEVRKMVEKNIDARV